MKQITKHIVKNSLKRLFQYRLCLMRFRKMGFDRVFSYNLGEEAGVSPEQVRKDFSEYKIKGNKKGGYLICNLLEKIDGIFESEERQNVIIVGIGNIGRALASYKRFEYRKMIIVAAFDIDPSKQNRKFKIPILPMEKLPEVINKNKVTVGIIAVPEISAQDVCDQLVHYGVKGILNFAPVVLRAPKDIVINNVNICDELEGLIYTTKKKETV